MEMEPVVMAGNAESIPAEETFKSFITKILSAAIDPQMVEAMVSEAPLEQYFRRAFTHRTFAISRAPKKTAKFDYEVLEKIGDRVLAMAFNLWLFEIMGEEVTVPQIYSDMEKRLTSTDYLAELAGNLGFDRWIQVAQGTQISEKIKEDVFESFIAAIVLAADNYVVQDIGAGLAKRWIFQVYNTYTREKINPKDPKSYVDFRSQVNDLWQFHGWGTPLYKGGPTGTAAMSVGAQPEVEVDLIAPNIMAFPEAFRGLKLGSGRGRSLDEAKEMASEKALETIGASYSELRAFEIQLSTGEPGRFKEILQADPALLKAVTDTMLKVQSMYQTLAIRKLKAYNIYSIQLRVQVDGIWKSAVRTKSDKSFEEAILKAFRVFVNQAGKGKLNF